MHVKYLLLFPLMLLSFCGNISSVQDNASKPVLHDNWTALLKKHVSDKGNVDYKGFIKDSSALNKYLGLLSSNAPNERNWSRDEQKAYWINAYNAFTIRLVLDHYPLQSIKDIGSKIQVPFVNTPWDIKFIKIGNETITLNAIEHDILRKKYEDPRIHFAIVCASFSCPRLRNEAYVAGRLDKQLDEQATGFINDDQKNSIATGKAEISSIFNWFKKDFTKHASLISFLNTYSRVKLSDNAEITYKKYDWKLNE